MESDASDASAESSPTEAPEFICHLGQRIVTEIKGAMLEAIRKTASQTRSTAGAATSQLEDLSAACTNEICEKILALYRSEELDRPGVKKTSLNSNQEVHGIMKSLEQVVSINRSSSCSTASSVTDLGLTTAEVKATDCPSSAAQTERPFSDQFMSKASQVISDVLLKTEQKLTTSLSSQTSGPVCSETELKFMSELAKSTSAEILQKLFYILVQSLREHLSVVGRGDADQSGAEREQKFLSEARKIHTDIHKQVFRFFQKRQQAVSDKSQTLLDIRPSAEPDVSVKNLQEPDAAEHFLDQATRVTSNVLVKRLNSHISTGSISIGRLGSGTTPPSKESVDLDRAVSDNVNKLLNEEVPEIERTNMGTESEAGQSDEKSERKPSVQSSSFTPLHLLTVMRNQMKAFVSSFKRSDDNEKTETLESTVSSSSEQRERHVGRSYSDSVLERRKRTLRAIQFPAELIYMFVEESTKGLLQNVLNTSSQTAEVQGENKPSKTRYIVKTDRRLVVKKQKKKRSCVPPSPGDVKNTSTVADLYAVV